MDAPQGGGPFMDTCQTPAIDPGASTAGNMSPPEVMGRFRATPGFAFTEPVTGAGSVTPRPPKNIVTTVPALARLPHVLREPSLLKASGTGPPPKILTSPLALHPESMKGSRSRNATGLRGLTRRGRESEILVNRDVTATVTCEFPAISNGT